MTSLQAGRFACERANWQLTGQQLHKILYLAHVLESGLRGQLLIEDESFEAWNVGPVLSRLYQRTRCFGADPIKQIFRSIEPAVPQPALSELGRIVDVLGAVPPWRLVQLVHQPESAWSRSYDSARPRKIPQRFMEEEFRIRQALVRVRKDDVAAKVAGSDLREGTAHVDALH